MVVEPTEMFDWMEVLLSVAVVTDLRSSSSFFRFSMAMNVDLFESMRPRVGEEKEKELNNIEKNSQNNTKGR